VLDLGVDTSTPTDEMFSNMVVTLAQRERRIIGERTTLPRRCLER